MLDKLRRSIKARGPMNTFRLGVRWSAWRLAPGSVNRIERWLRTRDERAFDRRHGTDTSSVLGGPMADVAGHENMGTQYEATTSGAVRLAFRHLDLAAADWRFLDVGCGKGKVMLLAAEHGFREAIGVEYSPTLATIAASNLEQYRSRHPRAPALTCVHGDALELAFPSGPLVVWLYNPFGGDVMARFVERLEAHVHATGAPVYVAYSNPLEVEMFDRSEVFERVAHVETVLQQDCVIFGTRDGRAAG